MKIEINIEKKHLIFFGIFLLLVVGGYAVAQGTYNPNVFHESLLVDFIKSKSAGPVTIEDNLMLSGTHGPGSVVDGYAISWDTDTTWHWNVDQYGTNPVQLRFFTKDGNGDVGNNKLFLYAFGDTALEVKGNLQVNGDFCNNAGECWTLDQLAGDASSYFIDPEIFTGEEIMSDGLVIERRIKANQESANWFCQNNQHTTAQSYTSESCSQAGISSYAYYAEGQTNSNKWWFGDCGSSGVINYVECV